VEALSGAGCLEAAVTVLQDMQMCADGEAATSPLLAKPASWHRLVTIDKDLAARSLTTASIAATVDALRPLLPPDSADAKRPPKKRLAAGTLSPPCSCHWSVYATCSC
jgi:hypothetical protein